MKTPVLRAIAVFASLVVAAPALAQSCGHAYCGPSAVDACGAEAPTFGQHCKYSYMQNIMWPKQYVRAARSGICQAFETQVNNGWRRHCLLSGQHFEANDQRLTESGRLKAQWILTQAPVQRRNVFIERGADQEVTAARVAGVHDYAATLGENVAPVSVQETTIRAHARPANAVDSMFTDFAGSQWSALLNTLETTATQQ